ncbi:MULTISPECIES: hypothetical protein [Bacillus]|uniref:hypothetical protein n=1 Tax=Bacillus TaxID=1386 RepID=UPI0003ED9997|nr:MULTISPECIES: hypothetical protein [Bacillus]EWH19789.1 hypothetical protein M769_0125200 [Bacillus haynesii]MEC0552309.1 hypothetical protein [Bacillus haynesii]QAS14983.1 hypothetical protein EQJ69_03340 [Bacillus licheniformis]QEO05809.1 hypothetical protein FLQ07_09605 [Bacillus paralicheniformis]WMW48095.1 hypothetical protein RFN66_03635 [Bacillus paralicheniformis]
MTALVPEKYLVHFVNGEVEELPNDTASDLFIKLAKGSQWEKIGGKLINFSNVLTITPVGEKKPEKLNISL